MKTRKFNIRCLISILTSVFLLLFFSQEAFAKRSRSSRSKSRASRSSSKSSSRASRSSAKSSSRRSHASSRRHISRPSRTHRRTRSSTRNHITRSSSALARSSSRSRSRAGSIRSGSSDRRSRGETRHAYSSPSRRHSRGRSTISTRLRSRHSGSSSIRSGSPGVSSSKGISSSLRSRLSSAGPLDGISGRRGHSLGADNTQNSSSLSGRSSRIGDFIGRRSSSSGYRSARINREVKLYEGRSPHTGRGIFTDITSSGFARKINGEGSSKAGVKDNSPAGITRGRRVRTAKGSDDSPSERSRRRLDGRANKTEQIHRAGKKSRQLEDTTLARNPESTKSRKVAGGRMRKAIPGKRKKTESLRKQIMENSKSILNRLNRRRRTSVQSPEIIKDTDSKQKLRRTSMSRNFGSKKVSETRKHRRVKTEKDRKNFARSKQHSARQKRFISKHFKGRRGRHRKSRPVYRERKDLGKDIGRHEHIYMDRDRKVCHRRVKPRFRFIVSYGCGPYLSFRAVYPYYLRRYMFVNLGGYWPRHYRYVRYHWYGCHPYYWYGYHPIACELGGDTHNYYTYNYYYDHGAAAATTDVPLVDYSSFYEYRRQLAEELKEPSEPTEVDQLFQDAVEAFEMGAYKLSAELFAKAMELAPDDMILPFAYCQAFFAREKYSEAAEVLRAVLAKVKPDKKSVFYPRGLYKDEKVLLEQIENLSNRAELYCFDADLQLLLGYQLLGMGKLDEAVEPLRLAALDLDNASSASVLLGVLEQLRQQIDNGQQSLQFEKEGKL